jgi:hypothetical protein
LKHSISSRSLLKYWIIGCAVTLGLLSNEAYAQLPCCSSVPHLYHVAAASGVWQVDLVDEGRRIAKERGMAEARESLEALMQLQDSTLGDFERELIRAKNDPSFAVADAVQMLPRTAERGRLARQDFLFLFLNGLGQTRDSLATKLLVDATAHLRAEGFPAEILETSPFASTQANARMILPQLGAKLSAPSTKHVVIVAISKGTHDLVEALAMNADKPTLTAAELGKINFVVSISGILRRSAVAGWLVRPKGLLPRLVRAFMQAPLIGKFPNLDGIQSLTMDPWDHLLARGGARGLRCTWLNYAVFPDGADGHPRAGFLRTRLLRGLRGSSKEIGPYDGLTESASSVLPPGTGLEQWIVRIRGAHGVVKGKYLDGTPVVALESGVSAAVEIIEPLLRCIPTSHLDREPGGNDLELASASPVPEPAPARAAVPSTLPW